MPAQIELDQDLFDRIVKSERQLQESLALIDDAVACGVECDQIRAAVTAQMANFQEIRKRFFNPPPV